MKVPDSIYNVIIEFIIIIINMTYIQCTIMFIYLVCTDVPNSGRGLVRLEYRSKEWDEDFTEYLRTLDAKKPVILCGDLNVAHTEIGAGSQ